MPCYAAGRPSRPPLSLELSPKKRDELVDLIDRASLEAVIGASKKVIDRLLSRSIPLHRGDEYEHLIVELKRPTQKLNSHVVTQIKQYAFAVIGDERFAGTNTRWFFLALSNEMNEFARQEVTQSVRPPGVCYQQGNVIIYLKTWAQVLAACRARMDFFRKELGTMATHEEGLEHLRKFYKEHIPDLAEEHADDSDGDHTEGATEERPSGT